MSITIWLLTLVPWSPRSISPSLISAWPQFLLLPIEMEKPELEQSSAQLSSQMEALKLEMANLEQVLPEQLAVSYGSLLDKTALLESLNESKEKVARVRTLSLISISGFISFFASGSIRFATPSDTN
ncbi:hypothetical protein niasHT_002054 [Heterodera trifolii]|uniref:Dynein heavy chain ATP-binding dynein motor region domain-containing protein n=1 Tax=Heterodera trifolii TaxID=157864 RepID=A0ABD2M329_9BILA